MKSLTLLVLIVLSTALTAQLPRASLAGESSTAGPLSRIPALIDAAIARGEVPGAVVIVGRGSTIVYEAVRGERVCGEHSEPLTIDTVFDMASLTKCLATTSAVLRLAEQGKISLSARLSHYLPEFTGQGKEAITVEMLLRHRGGLLPDNALRDYEHGREHLRARLDGLGLRAPVNEKYIYTDVGFILLGFLVEKVTGETLDRYVRREIFEPLGMADTMFHRKGLLASDFAGRPFLSVDEWEFDADRYHRIAPTEPARAGGADLRGIVHDPRARLMDGVAGHAGLFSTADDVALFAAMLLAAGRPVTTIETRVFSRETVERMTNPARLPMAEQRALGWDLRPFEVYGTRPGGSKFPFGSFGHTGFTGTSLWMDPATRTFVVILASRLHPDGKGSTGRLRREIGDAVAEAVGY